jgi:hypothetical protein
MGDDPGEPSAETLTIVINSLVEVSDLVDDADQVEITDTLWYLGINTKGKIVQFADQLHIPPQVWAEYKAERLTFQIDDDWFWWFTSDPDLESFIYAMTVRDVADMAEGYSDWPLGS